MIDNRCDCKPLDIELVNKAREKMPDYRDITDLSDFFKNVLLFNRVRRESAPRFPVCPHLLLQSCRCPRIFHRQYKFP